MHGHAGFDVRVGIHSGGVLAGGGVDTYRLVQGRFDVQQGQSLRIKGIDTPMLTYQVERERPRSAQAVRRGLDGATAALVGRDADLLQMRAALAAVQAGHLCDAIGHQQIGAQGRCNLAGVLTELGSRRQRWTTPVTASE